MSNQIYWVLSTVDYTVLGPFSFKEAVTVFQSDFANSSKILREVIDEMGDEIHGTTHVYRCADRKERR